MTVAATTIAFDADDTLWHNETAFRLTQERYRDLILQHVSNADVDGRLFQTEVRNLEIYGYGIKAFTLSMVETAIDLTGGRIPAIDIEQILDWGKEMLVNPVELMPDADTVTAELRASFRLMLITKGDLFDQESKIARSGLAERFEHIEIVSEKDVDTYSGIFQRHRIDPAEVVMVGNSLKFDIFPVIEAGARAIHVPYHVTWQHEQVEEGVLPPGAIMIERLGELPALLRQGF